MFVWSFGVITFVKPSQQFLKVNTWTMERLNFKTQFVF